MDTTEFTSGLESFLQKCREDLCGKAAKANSPFEVLQLQLEVIIRGRFEGKPVGAATAVLDLMINFYGRTANKLLELGKDARLEDLSNLTQAVILEMLQEAGKVSAFTGLSEPNFIRIKVPSV